MRQISTKEVTTRKVHFCFACLRKFDRGTKMKVESCVNDGDMYTVYSCETCEKLMTEFEHYFLDDVENIFPQGCVTEGYMQDIKTPEDLLIYLKEQKELV